MPRGASGSFGAQLKSLREAAGFSQEELATIAGLSVHAVSALERGERRRPHVETVRALCAALDLTGASRAALVASARAPAPGAAVDELIGTSLPVPPTALVGREDDLQSLRNLFADPTVRLITLTGAGGVGKTRLALEFARAIIPDGQTRVLFVELAAMRSPALVASAIAESLGLSDVTPSDLPRRARAACADRPMLLVLDNFEQVLDAAPLAAEVLTVVETLRLLITSRAPLRLRGEREHAVRPLAVGPESEALSPADLARLPALRLFAERARDVQPDFRLTAANGSVVMAICKRLDALPLALELAAPWIKVLSAESLLHRLDQGVMTFAAGSRDLPERQQTMNATVAWSYRLLQPEDQRAFRRFGSLPGRFPIEAAAAVLADNDEASETGDALGAVAQLIDKSLLVRADVSTRTRPLYQMLETVRAYAATELSASGERQNVLAKLARYCSDEATRAGEGLPGPAQVEWLSRVRDDLDSIREALTWLLERGRAVEAAGIAWSLLLFWLIRGHAMEGLRWYEQIMAVPSVPPDAEIRALVGAASLWYSQGEFQRARSAVLRALQLAQTSHDTPMRVHADLVLAHVDHAEGQTDGARERFIRSLDGFRALGIPWGCANALTALALLALAVGDMAEAERRLDEAAPTLRLTGLWFSSLGRYARVIVATRRGNADEVIALARDNLADVRDLQDKFVFMNTLVPLAAAAAVKGDDAWTARILGACDAVTERTGIAAVDRSMQELRKDAERGARIRLSADQWQRAYVAGRASSIDSLIDDIDRAVSKH